LARCGRTLVAAKALTKKLAVSPPGEYLILETYSGYKMLEEERTDRILGAHILGSEADEVINLFALALEGQINLARHTNRYG
jgi:pyruvate/2-oxoglutarate dehydrogenase complex dihydrolipoamide dehydrogenase (E3) component